MTPTPVTSVRLVFDKERKLKAKHRFIREAVRESGKSIDELIRDPFLGYAYLLRALLQPGATDQITLDKASDLMDAYYDNGGTVEALGVAMSRLVATYLRIEQSPTPEEESDPNATSPATTGGSGATD